MENFWTSNKTINGLRHFVLVNETKEQGKISFLMFFSEFALDIFYILF